MSDEQGRDLKALANRPELGEHLEWVWLGFWDLSSDRQIGFGRGPIMWTSMDAYGRRHRLERDRFDRFVTLLRRMDSVYLTKTAPKPPSPPRP